MFVLANFVSASAEVLSIVLIAMEWLIIIGALLSWVNPDPNNPIVRVVYKLTEPLLYPIRRILPFSLKFGLDISPLIAIVLIIFLQLFLVASLKDWAVSLRFGHL